MNNRLFLLTVVVGLLIVAAGIGVSFTYYRSDWQPAKETVVANASDVAIAVQTSEALAHLAATQTQAAIQTGEALAHLAATQTQSAIPTETPTPPPTSTPTSAPTRIVCEAQVAGTKRSMYPLPSFGSYFFASNLSPETPLRVTAGLKDSAWVEVDQKGWMPRKALQFKVPTCQPTVYDLHYLLNWQGSLLVDDTFASNDYEWSGADSVKLKVTNEQGESWLPVDAHSRPVLFSTDVLRQANLPAFQLHTAFAVKNYNADGYVGVRMRDSGSDYYELRFYRDTCSVAVYENDTEIIPVKLNSQACYNEVYNLSVTLTSRYELAVAVNGYELSPIALKDPDGRFVRGGLQLVTKNVSVKYFYLVISASE